MTDLRSRHCQACESGTPPLDRARAEALLRQIPDWTLSADTQSLERRFAFEDYYETMAFVNAVAFIAHREDHHPDLEVSYASCRIRYSTHSVSGLSENDFICAAKVDALRG